MRVPYSPCFLTRVRDGNVLEITSTGTSIQGTFEQAERYQGSKPTNNAHPLDTGAPW